MTMTDEAQIRQRAYELWEKDARPDGAEEFYWRLAQDQLERQTPHTGVTESEPADGEWHDLHEPERTGEKSTVDSEWPAKGEASRVE
jgi:hypothetical protein